MIPDQAPIRRSEHASGGRLPLIHTFSADGPSWPGAGLWPVGRPVVPPGFRLVMTHSFGPHRISRDDACVLRTDILSPAAETGQKATDARPSLSCMPAADPSCSPSRAVAAGDGVEVAGGSARMTRLACLRLGWAGDRLGRPRGRGWGRARGPGASPDLRRPRMRRDRPLGACGGVVVRVPGRGSRPCGAGAAAAPGRRAAWQVPDGLRACTPCRLVASGASPSPASHRPGCGAGFAVPPLRPPWWRSGG